MAYDLTPERVPLDLDGPSVEVYALAPGAIHALAVSRAGAWAAATGEEKQLVALRDLYEVFIDEAQPTWDLLDHHGPIPPTVSGLLRVPVPLGLSIVTGWLETAEPKASAVDEMVPPGELRDELNRRLKSVKKAA